MIITEIETEKEILSEKDTRGNKKQITATIKIVIVLKTTFVFLKAITSLHTLMCGCIDLVHTAWLYFCEIFFVFPFFRNTKCFL